jgi:uncharacterized damage-inducible protein DinB
VRLNTHLLVNCLADVMEWDAARRVAPGVNSRSFIVAHLVDARHVLATMLGDGGPNPLGTTLESATSIDDVEQLPTILELSAAWSAVTARLVARLESASAAQLAAPAPQTFPVEDGTLLGGLAFLLQRESFHVGQLALLRKQLGYASMRYDAR